LKKSIKKIVILLLVIGVLFISTNSVQSQSDQNNTTGHSNQDSFDGNNHPQDSFIDVGMPTPHSNQD